MNDEPDAPRRPDRSVPDPHAAEPAPPPQEGLRPEADASLVRPGEDEPNGPIGGLFKTAAAEPAARYGHVAGAQQVEAAAGVGVEEEGVEAGQLFGLMLATALGVVVLILTIYFLFYSPKLEETREAAADVPADRYVELRESRAAAQERLLGYAVNEDSTYRLPIDAAMRLVAADYGGTTGADSGAARQGAVAPGARPPLAPAYNGLTWLTLTPAPAVRSIDAAGATAPPAPADDDAPIPPTLVPPAPDAAPAAAAPTDAPEAPPENAPRPSP